MYGEGALGEPLGTAVRKITVNERLQEEKQRLETRLDDVNKALAVLEKYPEVAEVVNTISKLY